ncbi:hypothetical protein [Pseudorhodobacter sp.]|uniref:hypothetical protein n=1 Tax=Pseudorhodobacter sp. TaxID=1934400 RepID=UPI002648B300|nr:hypothetical protein [Pseudorhodobacter sp.]MDN5787245.1 hypothetical protein [Pseudorhodobacter sp.]
MSVQPLGHPGQNLGPEQAQSDEAAAETLFGFWVFMMSDAILFGLLFTTYATMIHSTAGGPGQRELFDISSAFIETMILLFSSFTFGMASLALKYEHGTSRLLL